MPSGLDDMRMAPIPAGVDPDMLTPEPGRPERRRSIAASELRGYGVCNRAGEHLGRIEEIMIDLPSGRVAYAVLSFGGLFGWGGKLFAIPWQALAPGQGEFLLNIDRAVLESAPGFNREQWPDMADPEFLTRIYGYYGYQPYLRDEEDGR